MSLSIAHVLSSFGMGGQERVALDLARAHTESGHRVCAVALAPPPHGVLAAEFENAGVAVFSLGSRDVGRDPKLIWRLRTLFRRERVGVVHTHNPMPLIYAPIAARSAGARVIHTKHGLNPTSRKSHLARRALTELVSHFVCVSDATAEQARAAGECRTAAISVIRNGIDTSRFNVDAGARARVRKELGFDDATFVFGSVGRFDENKNHRMMVEALAELGDRDARLVLVGDGETRANVEAFVDASPVRERVHLLGIRRDVPELMAGFDAFLLTSRSEGLPLVIPEAMASALPVIATAVGGVPSVVLPGDTGVLVPSDDVSALVAAMAEVAGDSQTRQRMGQRARAVAESDYSVSAMSARYLKLYEAAA